MIAVFSDLHGNASALREALPEIQKADYVFCLGDTVGYRRHPEEAVRLVREVCDGVLQGNHDAAATGQLDDFWEMIPDWLARSLDDVQSLPDELFEWLAVLQPSALWENKEAVHGTLRDPLMEFLEPGASAQEHLAMQKTKVSLAGHTHLPLALSSRSVFWPNPETSELRLGDTAWALNPGSLGVSSKQQTWMEIDEEVVRWRFL